jgi:hypothetical protein
MCVKVREALFQTYLGLMDAHGWELAQHDEPLAGKARRLTFSLPRMLDCRVQLDEAVQQFESTILPCLERDLVETEVPSETPFQNIANTSSTRKLARRRVGTQMAFAVVALLDVGVGRYALAWPTNNFASTIADGERHLPLAYPGTATGHAGGPDRSSKASVPSSESSSPTT